MKCYCNIIDVNHMQSKKNVVLEVDFTKVLHLLRKIILHLKYLVQSKGLFLFHFFLYPNLHVKCKRF